jgi:hypothetical protein
MKYGQLTFVEKCGKSADNHILWKMVCDCGNERIAMATRVRSGFIARCNACAAKSQSVLKSTHGMRNTTEYASWMAMKGRCLCKTNKDYINYGAKGITVCKEWIHSFAQFYKDMGPKPTGFSIERIDNTKGYFPENCRWASRSEQQRNKITSRKWVIKGKTFNSMQEAATFFNVQKPTIGKWVHGFFDRRRNTFTKARDDCKQLFKY